MTFLLDGGMGQELVHRSVADKTDNLWSARILMDEYDLVKDLHKDFIVAGAEGITINSYAITPHRLKQFNLEEQFKPLQLKACDAATQARDESDKDVKILGCLPPLIGSYHRTAGITKQDSKDVYQRMIDIQAPHVDWFIAETVTSISEAEIIVEVAQESNVKLWLSYSVSDDDGKWLRSGEPLHLGLKHFEDTDIGAFLVNCSSPKAIAKSMHILNKFSKPFGGLPNGFVSVKPLLPGGDVSVLSKRDDFTKELFVNAISKYISNGASIIGGCCEVSPEYINAIHKLTKGE